MFRLRQNPCALEPSRRGALGSLGRDQEEGPPTEPAAQQNQQPNRSSSRGVLGYPLLPQYIVVLWAGSGLADSVLGLRAHTHTHTDVHTHTHARTHVSGSCFEPHTWMKLIIWMKLIQICKSCVLLSSIT